MIPNNKPYLIAETAFHHQGEINYLNRLIKSASEFKADAIKFHLLFDINDYLADDFEAFEQLRDICISNEEWEDLFSSAKKSGLDIVALCNDVKSLKWVNTEHSEIRAIEIHATGINDIFLLKEASNFKGTVILGTGGSSIDEIKFAVDFIKNLGKEDIFLMHGFQNYPTNYTDINFSKMQLLDDIFQLPIGYADHTDPDEEINEFISTVPQAMGFNVLEKHFTISPGEKRIDAQAAVSEQVMNRIRGMMMAIWQTRGKDPLHMSKAELNYGNTGPLKKALVARERIEKGEILTEDKIAFKRTNKSAKLDQKSVLKLIGEVAQVDIEKDEELNYSNIKFNFKEIDFSQFNYNEEK